MNHIIKYISVTCASLFVLFVGLFGYKITHAESRDTEIFGDSTITTVYADTTATYDYTQSLGSGCSGSGSTS